MSSSNPNLNHSIASPNRRTHRKRASALRLSSDTTTTLPEYIPATTAGGWHNHHSRLGEDEEDDKPPDYPDSAEEADEDTDTDSNVVYVQQLPPLPSPSLRPQTASPRRSKRFLPTHKRRQSTQQGTEPSDPYLDALLERSVHALEMSNTLLQSSISTQSSLSAILANDSPADTTLEARAIGLSSRIKDTWDARTTWADDLEEISRNVEGLFIEGAGSPGSPVSRRYAARSAPSLEGSVSSSLPSAGSLSSMRRNRRRPSLDMHPTPIAAAIAEDSGLPRLHYSQQNRSNLISPPPRALTQYVASTQDAESILLPSTIGLRSTPSVHHTSDWKPLSDLASSSTTSLLSTQSFTSSLPPKLTDKPLEPSTPAYNMLSSFVYRAPSSGSATPSTSFTSSFRIPRRGSSNGSTSTERSNSTARRRSSPSPTSHKSPDRIHRQDRQTHQTPKRGVSPTLRPMTPTVEESSASSSDGFIAKRTMQSLRKILDDQPAPQASSTSMNGKRLRPPAFMPRTPAPAAESGTSTATASISRLFTKGTHSSSTRAPSPPRQSAMKRSASSSQTHSPSLSVSTSTNGTNPPSPLPTSLSIPDLVNKVLSRGGSASATSSGQSTPSKRISFAELPESYASTRPPSSRFSKGNKSKRKGKGKAASGSSRSGGYDVDADAGMGMGMGGWWGGWLNPATGSGLHGLGASLARHEEKMEDRMTRSWGGRINSGFGGGGGLDEWAGTWMRFNFGTVPLPIYPHIPHMQVDVGTRHKPAMPRRRNPLPPGVEQQMTDKNLVRCQICLASDPIGVGSWIKYTSIGKHLESDSHATRLQWKLEREEKERTRQAQLDALANAQVIQPHSGNNLLDRIRASRLGMFAPPAHPDILDAPGIELPYTEAQADLHASDNHWQPQIPAGIEPIQAHDALAKRQQLLDHFNQLLQQAQHEDILKRRMI
ncbi:hypothetical protein GALMADRAFT_205844 [Galerina marginata CBS 339.88]|uniref:Uncharacterized protein n=1 Tax=Galerina marginata (strain CBS 339.88) TaxID=685588 RepID=A0A067TP34_GALM3|nr:hypothetical protein GALMADRAFT_205844 [Galerina marginata CBS 339.88]